MARLSENPPTGRDIPFALFVGLIGSAALVGARLLGVLIP